MEKALKTHKVLKIVFYITGPVLLFTALIFLIIGAVFFSMNKEIVDNCDRVEATITDISTVGYDRHRVVVTYTYGGTIYNRELLSYSSTYYEGMKTIIYVDPSQPGILFQTMPVFHIVFFVLGGIFGAAGIVCFFIPTIYKNKKEI